MSSAANARITALAADRAVHRAFHWLHLYESQIARWHREFLAIPAPPFGEQARAAWFIARFTDLGLANPHLDAIGNALAELPASTENSSHLNRTVILSEASHSDAESKDPCISPGPQQLRHPERSAAQSKDPDTARSATNPEPFSTTDPALTAPVILLSAHLDTIFPAGTDSTPREQDGKLLCPGVTDNGAGLAALLALAAAMKHAEITPATTILFAANVGEEGEGDLRGMRHLFSHSPYSKHIRSAIALEGAGAGTVVDRALGSRRLRVEITGPGGHSWADAGRPSPITALASAITALTQLALPSNPRTTLNCGTISGGTSVNAIPASATADLDLRSTSTQELESLESLVLSTLSRSVKAETRRGRARDGLRLKVQRIGDRAAGTLPTNAPLALSLRAVDRHLHLRTESRIGSTDANLPLSLGIPALAIGAGGTGGGIHTLNEWYSPEGRELALRRILLLLLDTCSNYSKEITTLSKSEIVESTS